MPLADRSTKHAQAGGRVAEPHVRPGIIYSHRNASSTEKLVFLEYVIVDKGQRSTVPMP